MTAKDAIRFQLKASSAVLRRYLSDLSDADLLVRPAPSANHIAWQLGHLIAAEAAYFLPKIPGSEPPTLPEGFTEQHSEAAAAVDPPSGFKTLEEYLALHRQARKATLAALENLDDADLDADPGLGWGDRAPTVASVFVIIANHDLMHGGQFTVVRRVLGKPVLF